MAQFDALVRDGYVRGVGTPRLAVVLVVLSMGGIVGVAPAGAGSTAVRQCRTSNFKISRGPFESALGHYRQTVRLRNATHTTCAVSGWFTVQLLNVRGYRLSSHEQRVTTDYFGISPKPTVTVSPGGSTSFAIDTLAPATSCPYSKAVAVTPPGGDGFERLSLSVLACAHFSVLPVQPDDHAIHP
jgi:hypothetical protein